MSDESRRISGRILGGISGLVQMGSGNGSGNGSQVGMVAKERHGYGVLDANIRRAWIVLGRIERGEDGIRAPKWY
jgi:hypothetical protein